MKFDQTDRRRVVFASIVTLVALPAVWMANEDRTSQTGVAAVGVDPGRADPEPVVSATSTTLITPAYLTPTMTLVPPPPPPSLMIGAGHDVVATGTGTYRRSVRRGWCEVSGASGAERVTVVNSATGRSVDCRVDAVPGRPGDGVRVVLAPLDFDEIANFTDAPIHVEVRR